MKQYGRPNLALAGLLVEIWLGTDCHRQTTDGRRQTRWPQQKALTLWASLIN